MTSWKLSPENGAKPGEPDMFRDGMAVFYMKFDPATRFGCELESGRIIKLPGPLKQRVRKHREGRTKPCAPVQFILPFKGGSVHEIHFFDFPTEGMPEYVDDK